MKILQKLFLGLSLAFGAILLVGCGSSTPGEIANDFTTNMYKGNGDVLIEYIHIPENAKKGEVEMVDGKLKAWSEDVKAKVDQKGGLKSVEIIDEKIDGDKATVKVKTTFNDNSSKEEKFNFTQVNGDWKINLK